MAELIQILIGNEKYNCQEDGAFLSAYPICYLFVVKLPKRESEGY